MYTIDLISKPGIKMDLSTQAFHQNMSQKILIEGPNKKVKKSSESIRVSYEKSTPIESSSFLYNLMTFGK